MREYKEKRVRKTLIHSNPLSFTLAEKILMVVIANKRHQLHSNSIRSKRKYEDQTHQNKRKYPHKGCSTGRVQQINLFEITHTHTFMYMSK